SLCRAAPRSAEWAGGRNAHGFDPRHRHPTFSVRTPEAAAPRCDRLDRRDRHRVVRFLPLQHRHRPRLRQAVLPELGPLGGNAPGLRHLRRRLRRAPGGPAIFGHYGDRIGRKSTLIATLLVMGLATFAVALVPTYASIGIWGAVILTILRFIQGIGVGGEWG